MTTDRVSLEQAVEFLQRAQAAQGSRDFRLTVRKHNPGGLTAHQTTDVQAMYVGFDWQAGQIILEPARPLTELTAEQVEAIVQSVRDGNSWHAYQRDKRLRDEISELKEELKALRPN